MIHLLPRLLLWRRRKPTPGPQFLRDVLRARVRHIAAPLWQHRPPEPFEPAEVCGQCGDPIPATSVDGEYCTPKCHAAWLSEHSDVISKFIGPCPVTPIHSPEPPPEPAWLANWTAWEQEKARLLIESRKSPEGEVAA